MMVIDPGMKLCLTNVCFFVYHLSRNKKCFVNRMAKFQSCQDKLQDVTIQNVEKVHANIL